MRLSDNNRLSLVDHHLNVEWDYDANNSSPSDFSYGSGKIVQWKCSKCEHKWKAKICDRHHGNGCPKCKRKKVINGNSLENQNPILSKEWNYVKNQGLTPQDFTPNSHKLVWWKCNKCNHEWEESINKRNQTGNTCFRCRCLAVKCPILIDEWNWVKNGDLTPYDISFRSKKKVWWKCKICNHEWETDAGHRVAGRNCPACNKVKLYDGSICDSWVEAYVYLKYKEDKVHFIHQGEYGKAMGRRKYDFYLPDSNTYIEVTSFKNGSIGISWFSYLRNIVLKKRYVESILNANFEFKNLFLSPKHIDYVRKYTWQKDK